MSRRIVAVGLGVLMAAVWFPLEARADSDNELDRALPCSVEVVAGAADAVLVGSPKGTVDLEGDVGQDPFYQTYRDADGAYEVEVWRGESSGPEASEEMLQKLFSASLVGVSDSPVSELADTFSFDELPELQARDVVATRVELGDRVELTVHGKSPGLDRCVSILGSESDETSVETLDGNRFVFSNETNVSPTATSSWTQYRHRTFIPDETASTGIICGIFKGDDRSWSSSSSVSHRTSAYAKVDWSAKTISTTRTVGQTERLKGNGWSAAKKTASADGIKFVGLSAAATSARFEIVHSVANPLCAVAGAISYSEVVNIYKSGGVSVQGNGVQVPSHELYAYKSDGSARTVAQLAAKKFICLNVNCGRYEVNKSVK